MHRIAFLSTAHIHTRGYLDRLAKLEGAEFTAVWDDLPERGRRYADQYGARFEPDLKKMVHSRDVDAFIVCAENTRHLPLLKAALPTRKPVFCEKPFVTTSAQVRTLKRLIDRCQTPIHTGYYMPFRGPMQGLIKLLATGKLGRITHVHMRNAHHAAYGRWFDKPDLAWFTDPELAGGGAFMDLGTHAVHLLRTLFGPVARVQAMIGNRSGIYPAVDDFGMAFLEFRSGIVARVEASWVQNGGPGGIEISGSEGTVFEMPERGLVFTNARKELRVVEPGPEQPTQVDRLVAAIEHKLHVEDLQTDLDASLDAVLIMEACYKSSRLGRPVLTGRL